MSRAGAQLGWAEPVLSPGSSLWDPEPWSCCLSVTLVRTSRRWWARTSVDWARLCLTHLRAGPGRAGSGPPCLHLLQRLQRQPQAPACDHTVTRVHGRLHLTFGDSDTPRPRPYQHFMERPCSPHPLPKLPAPRSQVGPGCKVRERNAQSQVPCPRAPGRSGGRSGAGGPLASGQTTVLGEGCARAPRPPTTRSEAKRGAMEAQGIGVPD